MYGLPGGGFDKRALMAASPYGMNGAQGPGVMRNHMMPPQTQPPMPAPPPQQMPPPFDEAGSVNSRALDGARSAPAGPDPQRMAMMAQLGGGLLRRGQDGGGMGQGLLGMASNPQLLQMLSQMRGGGNGAGGFGGMSSGGGFGGGHAGRAGF